MEESFVGIYKSEVGFAFEFNRLKLYLFKNHMRNKKPKDHQPGKLYFISLYNSIRSNRRFDYQIVNPSEVVKLSCDKKKTTKQLALGEGATMATPIVPDATVGSCLQHGIMFYSVDDAMDIFTKFDEKAVVCLQDHICCVHYASFFVTQFNFNFFFILHFYVDGICNKNEQMEYLRWTAGRRGRIVPSI